MRPEELAAAKERFGRLAQRLKKEGLTDPPCFDETLFRARRWSEPELTRWVREYANPVEFESLLFLCWNVYDD